METFVNCVKNNYSNFEGKASRKEFWLFTAFFLVLTMALDFLAGFFAGLTSVEAIKYLFLVFVFLMISPFLAVAVRRLHDVNRSGKFLFLALIPIVGIIIIVVWLCGKPVDESKVKKNTSKKKKLNKKI